TLESLAEADVSEVETYIHSTGFFRAKARDIVAAARMLVEVYGGVVPDNMEDLLKLPGVGRKTANLILGDVYHTPGVVVADTHCIRITGLLGLTDGTKDPVKTEMQLRKVLPPEESSDFCHRMVLHGRAVCVARRPDCQNCTLRPWCDHFQKSVRD
ncbi:endonuclease III domain-containing protein, partial [uncultured Flavonifractor sp.]